MKQLNIIICDEEDLLKGTNLYNPSMVDFKHSQEYFEKAAAVYYQRPNGNFIMLKNMLPPIDWEETI